MQSTLSHQISLISGLRHPQNKGFAALSIVTLLFMSGCVSTPALPEKHLDAQQLQQIQADHDHVLQQNQQLNNQTVSQQWWRLFNDPLLVQLEQQLLEQNLDLHSAALRIIEAQAQLGQAEAALQPRVSLDGGYNRSTLSENAPLAQLGAYTHSSGLWSIGVKSSWELDLWGHFKQLSQAAQANVEAKYFAQHDLQLSLSAELARQYFLLRSVQQQYLLHAEKIAMEQRLLEIAQRKFKYGVVTLEAVAHAEQQLIRSQSQQKAHVKQRQLLKNALAQLLGTGPKALDQLFDQAYHYQAPQQIPVGLSSHFVQQRADILVADAELRAAVAQLGAAQADFYPRVGLSANLGAQAFQFSDLGDWASSTYGVGPIIHIPIFEGGRLKRNLQVNQSRQRLAAVQYQRTVLNAWHEVDNALIEYQYQLQDQRDLSREYAQKNTVIRIRQKQFDQGVLDQAQVLNAKKELLEVALLQSQGQIAQALSIVGLYRALGGGGAQDWYDSLMQGAD
ncbi:NodT family efflux transporter outer membrane factor (OMF) lipoprotein [Acinetobacter calcoaceticus]|uniref:NodT family efflux transporter outer membrane factor (OMF) lipoprotein n=1 Tax=Acinetobacter calcoaceticus TaxID=471 RepID=A0A4R1Y097_ACICA|nr:NodT family efflux transporter outer membrane factor (OMF) lipoprotein [Acinetobacter calcoaceticus]